MSLELSTLENGLRIVTETRKTVETASIGLWCDVGSRYEEGRLNGISHCLEHMVFKGTENRDALEIALTLERVGGHLNAYTTRDHTCYYARVLKEDAGLAVDLLADLLRRSLFDADELAREQDVILQELYQAQETPDDIIFDHLQAQCFSNQPLGASILGSVDTIKGFTRTDLMAYLSTHYCPRHMVVSAVGNITHDQLVAIATEYLGDMPACAYQQAAPARFTGGVNRDQRDLEQVHMAMAFEGAGYHDADYFALQALSMAFGGGMSSRLFQEIREKSGLAYTIHSFTGSHFDSGVYGIYGATAPDRAEEALDKISGELKRAPDSLLAEEIEMAKVQLKAGLMMAMEGTTNRMEQIGRQTLLFDTPLESGSLAAKIDAVSESAVRDLAARYAGLPNHALALVGGPIIKNLSLT